MSVLFSQEDERVEIPLSEYETLKTLGPKIAQQNALVLDAIKTLTDNVGTLAVSLKELLQGMNIVVNVPEQPAPVVNFMAPEQAAPVVNVTMPDAPVPVVNVTTPEQKPRTVKVKRNKNGYAEGYIIE